MAGTMTKHDALRAARALLDGMAGTTDGEWTVMGSDLTLVNPCVLDEHNDVVCDVWGDEDAAHIARSCPARLGPVLRALMEGD